MWPHLPVHDVGRLRVEGDAAGGKALCGPYQAASSDLHMGCTCTKDCLTPCAASQPSGGAPSGRGISGPCLCGCCSLTQLASPFHPAADCVGPD